MNHFVYFFKTLNIARSEGSLPECKENTLRSILRLTFDLLFFKDTASTSSVIPNTYSKNLFYYYSSNIPQFFFYQEPENIDLFSYYSNLYRPNDPVPLIKRIFSDTEFIKIKNLYNLFLTDDITDLFDFFNIFNENDHLILKTLFIKDVFNEETFDDFFFAGYNLEYEDNLSKEELLCLLISDYLNGSIYLNFKLKWITETDDLDIGLGLLELSKYNNFDMIKITNFMGIIKQNVKSIEISSRKLEYLDNSLGKFINVDKNYTYLPNENKSNFIINNSLITVNKNKLELTNDNSLICKQINQVSYLKHKKQVPLHERSIKVLSFIGSPINSKSYTMRSRQFYRSGVLFCLTLTLITILGPYYLFYGVTFVFSYWWFIALLFFFRYFYLFLVKITPFKYKIKITNYINSI